MGTIVKRPRKDGSVAYMAQIMITREGKTLHRETRTFDRRGAAQAWIEKREEELAAPDAKLGIKQRAAGLTLSDAIDRYTRESLRSMGRTKEQVLRALKGYDIAAMPCDSIRSPDLVAFAQELLKGRSPATVGNYLSHLSSIFELARPAWGIPLDKGAMDDALVVCKRLGVVAKSKQRERRPTLEELEDLMLHMGVRDADKSALVPMQAIVVFALFSARRQEEITNLRWEDLDEAGSRILVRDMKNPNEKSGNHVWCDLPPEALRVLLAQPRQDIYIFPCDNRAVSSAFTRACKALEIEDLHFHDLRHEGISRLFEMGWNIPHVAAVSGHRSWSSLKRYTHLRATGDKYAGWKWVDVVCAVNQ